MYILFDIGGTKTRIASSEDLRTFVKVVKFDTPPLYIDGIKAVIAGVKEVLDGNKVSSIAGGIRGPLNHEKTGIVSETKLCDWVGRNIVEDLRMEFDTDIFLENDTAMVGLGEVVFGAGKDHNIVAYHTVSTGVGGARFVGGHIDVSSVGFEPGHQILDIDRTLLGPTIPPTLENLVSGTALEKRRGVKPYEIAQDDSVWDELALQLAYGLKNTIVYWSPDAIVLGGSMVIGDPRIPLEMIKNHTEEVLDGLLPCPIILDATLKDEGGLYGAMALLKDKLDII
ncbi:MAG: ROK family protein [Candidatus Pacebacteria bacterium]|nr:ROK family protein [Candidatus Paceibacterota bacterium]MCF7857112.1 ROK family protein [Candidatus Paceibacterota bacterium]